MSWDITITPPPSFPDVDEPIFSFSNCPGNMYTGIKEMKSKQLREMDQEEAITALKDLIIEIDKKNDGLFSDEYAVESDKKWSEGRESREDWERCRNYIEHMPYKTYEGLCGYTMRLRIREAAVRFFLYYVAGYKIEFNW